MNHRVWSSWVVWRSWLVAAASLSLLLPVGCVPATDQPADNANANAAPPTDDIEDSLENAAPLARAGENFSVSAGAEVSLDATASSDPDADRLSFVWSQVDGETNVDFTSSPFAAVVTFTAPDDLTAPLDLTFTVAVLDGFAAAFDEITITINPE